MLSAFGARLPQIHDGPPSARDWEVYAAIVGPRRSAALTELRHTLLPDESIWHLSAPEEARAMRRDLAAALACVAVGAGSALTWGTLGPLPLVGIFVSMLTPLYVFRWRKRLRRRDDVYAITDRRVVRVRVHRAEISVHTVSPENVPVTRPVRFSDDTGDVLFGARSNTRNNPSLQLHGVHEFERAATACRDLGAKDGARG